MRGTPQQIIDKYNQLARDAQLGNDRVATENFQQHAEHYLRMLSEAQREMEARREEQERQNRERQAERDRERAARAERQERESNAPTGNADGSDQMQSTDDSLDVIDGENDSGLVETPEAAEKPKRGRRPKKQDDAAEVSDEAVAEKPAPKPRRPRKPKAEAAPVEEPKAAE